MRSLKKILINLALIALLTPLAVYPQKKVEYGGYFEAGGKTKYKDLYIESYYKAKLEYKLKINEFTKVEIDIRGNSEDRQIELYEGSATFKVSPRFKIEVGDLKKRYGLEEQTSHEKLPTISTGMINNYLEPLGFVSRDPGIQLHWNDEEEKTSVSGGLFNNESHRFTIMTRIDRSGFMGLDRVGGGVQLARERDTRMPNTFIASADAAKDLRVFSAEAEVFYGQDPVESYYRKTEGRPEMVYFLGARALLIKNITVGSKYMTAIEPLLIASVLAKDADRPGVNTVECLIGVNVYISQDVRFMINGDLLLANHEYDKKKRTMSGSNFAAQMQLRW